MSDKTHKFCFTAVSTESLAAIIDWCKINAESYIVITDKSGACFMKSDESAMIFKLMFSNDIVLYVPLKDCG